MEYYFLSPIQFLNYLYTKYSLLVPNYEFVHNVVYHYTL